MTQTQELQTQAFRLQQKVSHYLRDRDFEQGTQAVYGKRIELIDTPNDTTHEYSGIGSPDSLVADEADLEEILSCGAVEAYRADVVLQDLHRRGVLPAGDYFIRVCW